MRAKELEKLLLKNGWTFSRQNGSHKMFEKENERDTIAIPAHGSKDIKIGTLKKILKQAGLK